jgi:thiol:disulfide interchange protein DsbA
MKKIGSAALCVLLASVCTAVLAQTPAPVAGKDYIEISNGRPLEPADGKVVVEEFFNYICPACNGFEPQFAAWTAQLPSYVTVVYVPAAFRADFVQYARAYYAAQTFDLADVTHHAVYDAIHRVHVLPAEGDKSDEARIASFYSDFGVDAQEFLAVMQSFTIDAKIRRATDHMRRSKVSSTPSIVVNGRYLVRGTTYVDMLRIASYLIEKEHTD